jgi:hypothetical protein
VNIREKLKSQGRNKKTEPQKEISRETHLHRISDTLDA